MILIITIIIFASYLRITPIIALPYDGWIQHSLPRLPRATWNNAIGYDSSNHTIWLLGDHQTNNHQQLISFDYINNIFTDYGVSQLPEAVISYGQNYAQIGAILYIASFSANYINSFNMKTMIFTTNYTFPHLYFNGAYCCIVIIRNEYIAVLGDDTTVQILNIVSQLWLDSVPSMIVGRDSSSCVYINNKIFNIGGINRKFKAESSIEYLNVSTTSMTNIESISWTYNTERLPVPVVSSRSITVSDDILVIGNDWGKNTIYVINSINGSVSLGGYLAKGVSRSAVIFVDNTIYSFGGGLENYTSWNGWQTQPLITNVLSTAEPTFIMNEASTTSEHKITVETIIQTMKSSIPSDSPSKYIITNSLLFNETSIFEDHKTTSSITEALFYSTKSTEGNKARENVNNDNFWFILMIISLSIFVIMVCILCGCVGVWIKKRKNEQIEKTWIVTTKSDDNNAVSVKQPMELAEVKAKKHNVLEMKNDIGGEHDSSSNESMYDMEGIEPEPTTKGNTNTEIVQEMNNKTMHLV